MKEKERMFDKNNITLRLEKITKKSIAENQMSRSRLAKKKSWQERGITLIALVVTIIILLILAGVTLNIALSDNGLFSKTKEAAEKYKQEQSDEEDIISQIATQMYSEYVGAKITGYTPEEKNCTITTEVSGYSSNQDFNSDTSINWRVWDFDGNTLRIIGDPTENTVLYLNGVERYNNGVWALEHVCSELYSNGKAGVTATTIKRSDILRVSNYDYTQYIYIPKNADESDDLENAKQYGEIKKINNAYYPEMWEANDQNWLYEYSDDGSSNVDKEGKIWEDAVIKDKMMGNKLKGGTETIEFKQSKVSHEWTRDGFINDKYFSLIFETSGGTRITNYYWLGTRFMNIQGDVAIFGLCCANEQGKNSVIEGFWSCGSNRYNFREKCWNIF